MTVTSEFLFFLLYRIVYMQEKDKQYRVVTIKGWRV